MHRCQLFYMRFTCFQITVTYILKFSLVSKQPTYRLTNSKTIYKILYKNRVNSSLNETMNVSYFTCNFITAVVSLKWNSVLYRFCIHWHIMLIPIYSDIKYIYLFHHSVESSAQKQISLLLNCWLP